MPELTDAEDAFGQLLLDYALTGETGEAFVERDDGYVEPALGAAAFFLTADGWTEEEREFVADARGRVLDVGCGAGRHALELQQRGQEVVGIDVSPKAVAVARERGVRDARVLALAAVSEDLGLFDSVLMMCGNFGLFGSREEACRPLRRLHDLTTRDATIVFDTIDPELITGDEFARYRLRNESRGRAPGQVTIRLRYGERVTPWFDLLNVGRSELDGLLARTGWRVTRLSSPGSVDYFGVLRKE